MIIRYLASKLKKALINCW